MKMKKIIAGVLAVSLTAAVSIGATLAYLSDTDEDVNVMTLGNVKIDQLEYERVDDETTGEDAEVQEFHDNKPLYPAVTEDGFDYTPGDANVDWTQIGKNGYTSDIWNPENINNELDKMVFVKNKGKSDAYVRTVFAFEAGKYTTLDEFKSMMHLNLNETDWTWEWSETPVTIGESTYFVATATYNKVLAPGALTEISLSQIALDKTAANADVEAFGETYQILVKTQAIQTQGFEDPVTALNEGFGEISTEPDVSIPWESDSPTKGTTLNNALHYLNGDSTGTAITSSVSSVVFGQTNEYADIVNNYDAVLVDVEQDVPVYAYYVPNGSQYDVYMLANDTIYAPKNANDLFRGMTAMKKLDTGNLDFSRTQTMRQMLRDCQNLEQLDVSGWNTRNVEDMTYLFLQCYKLKEITGLTNLDTSNVTVMDGIFRSCKALTDVDVSGWDTSRLTSLYLLFYECTSLKTVDLSAWDTGNVTNMGYVFYKATALTEVNANGWDTSNVTSMLAMFAKADKLQTVKATGWDVSKVENANGMFQNDYALQTVEGSGDWNFASATNVEAMFQNCSSLTSLDVTNWNLSNATSFKNMFRKCVNLETLNGSGNWNCSNVETMDVMFLGCYKLATLDVSNWDVSNVKVFDNMFASENSNAGDMALTELIGFENWKPQNVESMHGMFYGCGSLKSLDFTDWNVSKLTNLGHTFADCYSLESVNFTGWNTPSLVTMDAMFNHCTSLKMVDMSMFDTSNVKEFGQMFEICESLERIDGMNNWDTSSGCTFTEMFSGCASLTKLDLSGFDTSAAYDNYKDMLNSYSNAFTGMFSGMKSLQTLIVGEDIAYLGNGNVAAGNKLTFPAPAAKEGYTAKWRNVETGELYLANEIPEKTAATYEAYYEAVSAT